MPNFESGIYEESPQDTKSTDSETEQKKVSRKEFLRGAGLAVGGLALMSPFIRSSIENELDSRPKPTLEGPIPLGNINLHMLSIEHTEKDWKRYGESLSKIVSQFPTIIPEYFPPEYQHLGDNSLYTKAGLVVYESLNYLFEPVADQCFKEGKNVWVIDPAYGTDFILFRQLLSTPQVAMDLPASVYLANKILEVKEVPTGEPKSAGDNKMNRRDFLRKAFLNTAAVGVAVTGLASPSDIEDTTIYGITGFEDTNPFLYVEREFRRVLIAQQLSQLSKSQESPVDMLLIYPPGHSKEIKKYLFDEPLRMKMLDLFNEVRKIESFESLFVARNYVRNGNNWVKQAEQRI